MKYFTIISIVCSYALANANVDLDDIGLEDMLSMECEQKVEVGSRDGAKDYLKAKTAIDVITQEQIQHSGLTSLVDILRYFVAGFNAPEPSISDGSDHVRAFTLRGMSSDQILVLLNGKRVHASALLHTNATIGKGTSHADLDSIPVDAIKRVEILRDGAAAQYGSDAIAGVINIILKGYGYKNSATIQTGKRLNNDGKKIDLSTFLTIPLEYDGFINLTISANSSDKTQHAGLDRRLDTPVVSTHYGLPDVNSYKFLLNSEVPLRNSTILYSNVLINKRDSKASAFFRTPDNTRALYPDGFLPIIHADILDYQAIVGAKGELNSGISWDLSQIVSSDSFDFSVSDSINYSLNELSPKSFKNGELIFKQYTTNLDLKKKINNIFTLSGGAEYRVERYNILSGDYASYIDGGSQGFVGFQPANETQSKRNNYALYIDGVVDPISKLSLEFAGRFEDYSDFGTTTNMKLQASYDVSNSLMLRTSVSSGFRAPSLSQSNYSLTSTFYDSIAGKVVTQGTFKPQDPISVAQGAKPLKPEKSKHLSFGTLYSGDNYYFMADYFYTYVEDKIMLSDNIPVTIGDITAVRFFTNAVDTKTQGVDIKLNYNYTMQDDAKLDVTFWYNYNTNSVEAINTPYVTWENSLAQLDSIENGQPKQSQRVLINYKKARYNIAYNLSRFGSFYHVASAKSREFDPVITSDIQISYKAKENLDISIGGNNIFDKKPPLAQPKLELDKQVEVESFDAFSILKSQGNGEAHISVPADQFLCDDFYTIKLSCRKCHNCQYSVYVLVHLVYY